MGGALSRLFWRFARLVLGAVDRIYRRWNRLEPVGDLLYARRDIWRGPARTLDDGTEIAHGDPVVSLHLNNQLITAEVGAAGSAAGSGLRFARRFFPAYRALARRVSEDPAWRDIVAVHHIGLVPPHGERFGFEFERLPDGPRARWILWHSRNLMMAANPRAARRDRRRLWPMEVWLSRRRLLSSFLKERLPK